MGVQSGLFPSESLRWVIRAVKISFGSSLPGLIKALQVEWLEPGYASKAMPFFPRTGSPDPPGSPFTNLLRPSGKDGMTFPGDQETCGTEVSPAALKGAIEETGHPGQ